MPEETATLEPPAPAAETQPSALNLVQNAFDKAVPLKPRKGEVKSADKPVEAPKPPIEQPKPTEPEPEPLKPAAEQKELKLPSFVLGEEKEAPKEPEIKLDDLPKEPPSTASENEKINWKKTRTLLEKQDAELKTLREKQALKEEKGKDLSPIDQARLKQLEDENTQLKNEFKRVGLQQDPTFIAQVIQPLRATYSEAKRIIKDSGANPEQLDKALMLTGKAHYDAMDEILGELPESAKGELTSVMRDYRRYAQARAEAVANAPKVYEELQKQNLQNQRQYLETQKGDMEKLFENRVKFLRDNGLETLMESQEEDTKWWNEIPQKVKATAKKIALENQDMDVVMDASILAASAITYRDLYRKSEERARNAEKELKAIKGAEPRITDAGSMEATEKVDMKEPFESVFLRTLRKTAGR